MPNVEPEYVALGEAVRALRRERGLSQQEIAEQCGMSRSAFANIESGHQRVAFHQFLAMARALGVEPRELLPASTRDDHPADEHMLSLGAPEHVARAVARAVKEVTADADNAKPRSS